MLRMLAPFAGFFLLIICVPFLFPTDIMAGSSPLPYRNNKTIWHAPKAMHAAIKDATGRSKRTKIHRIGQSPAGHDLLLLEIAPNGDRSSGKHPAGPAILVVGNPLGETPLGTEGALDLARHILSDQANPTAGNVRWYILPCANPDAANGFFNAPLADGGRNATPIDDDKDGYFSEDGFEDINGDGLISQMLLADPEGKWILTDEMPARARKAEPAKGEAGLYHLLTEGFDNDGDGLWNEDRVGGVICGQNFPHRFEHWTTTGGLWPGDQPESRAILDFAFSHTDIAMVLILGQHDTLLQVSGKKSSEEKVSFRPYMAERLDVSPSQEFTMSKAVEMLQGITGNFALDEVKARHYLGGKIRTEPHVQDMPWWLEFGNDYKTAVYDTLTPGKPIAAKKIGPGSLSEWAYFQFGVPSFEISFWQLTENAETSSDSSSADEKPIGLNPVNEALINFKNMNHDLSLDAMWPGYLSWTPARLPDGREVLVGGEAPFSRTTPPPALVDSLLAARIPFLATMPARLPVLGLQNISIEPRGSGVFELTGWIANEGDLDYPTGQGSLCKRVPPVIITVDGGKILEGRQRTKVEKLPAHQSVPVRWLIQAKPGTVLKITAEAPSLGQQNQSITVPTQGGLR